MKDLVLNETSIRTSKNYKINNITISDYLNPKYGKFNNTKISFESEKDSVSQDVSKEELAYGISKEKNDEVFKKANSNIKINVNTKTNKSVLIKNTFDKDNTCLIDNIDIESEEGCKETITIIYESDNEGKYYHNGIIRVNAKKDSVIKINILNLLNNKSDNYLSIQNVVEDRAVVDYTYVEFGGRNSISNYYSNVLGKEGKTNIDTIFLGSDNQIFDANYLTDLRGEKTETRMNVQGALNDKAVNHFKGIIDFKKGCKKAKGNEEESCLLLSENAKSLAMPVLLCSEEDVEGSHGNSAGKVNEKELFYIMTRGFNEREAMKLLVKAKFNKIMDKFSNDEYKNRIIYEIDQRME